MLWPPNSVLLAALLLLDGRGLLPLALLVLLAEAVADVPAFSLTEALLFGSINVTESLVAFALLRRSGFDRRFGTLGDLRKFMLAGPVVASLLAALLGGAVYSHFRGNDTPYLEFVRVWWFGDGLGLLVFTPLLLGIAEARGHVAQRLRSVRPADWTVLALAIVALALFIGTRDAALLGMPVTPALLLPFAIAVAARFGLAVAAGTAAAMALAVAVKTSIGHAPFHADEAHEAVLRAQEFMFVLGVVTVGLAALLSEVRSRQREAELATARLEEANERLEARVLEKTGQLETLNRELRTLASFDALTGIANRRAFLEQANKEFDNSVRYGSPLSTLMLDLDHFKRVNDAYGHAAGDAVLTDVAYALRKQLRVYELSYRIGGEEFLVLVPGADVERCAAIAEDLRASIAAQPHGGRQITMSFGVAASDTSQRFDYAAVFAQADAELYAAKRAGRDRVHSAALHR